MQIDSCETELSTILENIDLRNKSILEIGCGNGRISGKILPFTDLFVGIDPVILSIKKANSFFLGYFIAAKGEQLPFGKAVFDTVICAYSFHHQNPEPAIDEIGRVLVDRGVFIAFEPELDSEVQNIFNLFDHEDSRISNAGKVLQNSGFLLLNMTRINVEWSFKNRSELYDFFFSFHQIKRNVEIIAQIDDVVGVKINNLPININDRVMFYYFIKPLKWTLLNSCS